MALLYLLYAALFTALLFVPFHLFPTEDETPRSRVETSFPGEQAPALHPERYPIRSVVAVARTTETLADVPATKPPTPKRAKVWPLKAAVEPLHPRRAKRAKPPKKDPARAPDTVRFKTAERLFGYGNFKGARGYYEAALQEGAAVLSPTEEDFIRRRLRECRRELDK